MDKQENESWNAYAKRMNYIYESELDGRELLLTKQEILEYEKDEKEIEAQNKKQIDTSGFQIENK